ncbi:hypothetical protein Q8G35_28155 [Peribacillus simplex]|uniref:Uncharacterized protein n=2 Tax=Peribacillus TaxID=2675229 RepID=A0AA90P5W5_9BACI|nr:MULTISPECIES: hypothetical protein [Peribacillus]MDP1422121.1 hypothetical protein [Peribacillus simplex]MDP1452821.1 hypothetical protein [Peribacillus frigoritolerans]
MKQFYLVPIKYFVVCLVAGLLFFFNESFVQAQEKNPNDKIVKLKDGETLNVAHPELLKKRDEVWEKITKSNFIDEVEQKLTENGYKKRTMTGEFDINFQIVDLEVDEKPGESRVETINNIDKIVRELAKENKVVPTITKVTFHKQ